MDLKRLQRILVPTDFSDLADRTLSSAITLAQSSGASLLLLHVIHLPYVTGVDPVALDLGGLLESLERDAASELSARVARASQQGVRAEYRVTQGSPHVEVVRFIEEQRPDLVVMSTHGRTGIAHAAMGSVAERVVQRSRSPVLVLPAVAG